MNASACMCVWGVIIFSGFCSKVLYVLNNLGLLLIQLFWLFGFIRLYMYHLEFFNSSG